MPERNSSTSLTLHARATPGKAAIIAAESGAVTTYQELNRKSIQCARLFAEQGLGFGDHIALMVENVPEAVCCGCMWASAPLSFLPMPRGVRQVSMIQASDIIYSLSTLPDRRTFFSKCGRAFDGIFAVNDGLYDRILFFVHFVVCPVLRVIHKSLTRSNGQGAISGDLSR